MTAPTPPPTTASNSSAAPPAPAGRVALPPGVGEDPRWVVLLYGDDPRAWNTSGVGGTYAVPLDRAPAGLKYLRLRRMDTGEALIVPLTRDRLVSAVSARDEPDAPFRWCGANRDEFGGRHLGIAEGPLLRGDASRGKVAVQMEGTDAFLGSGFGHEAYGDGQTQHFGWRGEKIAPTAFEIAVTAGGLTDSERPSLLSERLQSELIADLPPPPADADPGWTILLRGRDPSAWNTKGKGDTYALPLALAPGDVKYLRLKRLDNGEAVIIPLTRKDLSKEFPEGERPYRWCGTNADQWGARHLGIGEGPLLRGSELQGKGIVVVAMAGFDGYTGSGFGHEAYGDGRSQYFAWRGKKIDPTDFEIAVSSGELSADERKALLGP